jgi:hypothetical protein
MENQTILISKSELSKTEVNTLNEAQLQFILKKTPQKFIKERPAKGGGKWKYVSGAYVQKCLNLMFGWDWDFEILDEKVLSEAGEVIVKGRLTCRTNGKIITKTQYGNKDIIFKKETKIPLSIGNDLKSAATDSLKKCASLIGIAQDVFAPDDFKEVFIEEANKKDVALMLSNCNNSDELKMLWDSLSESEQNIYKNLFNLIKF